MEAGAVLTSNEDIKNQCTEINLYEAVTRSINGKTMDGGGSKCIWWTNDRSGAASANATNYYKSFVNPDLLASSTNSLPLNLQFAEGRNYLF